MLNNESIAAPQASQQLRRACRIMWRLQHGISPKTTKSPFVLCPCHCSFKTSAILHHSSFITHPHHPSLILHPSHGFLILPPAIDAGHPSLILYPSHGFLTWLPHPSTCSQSAGVKRFTSLANIWMLV